MKVLAILVSAVAGFAIAFGTLKPLIASVQKVENSLKIGLTK